MAVLSTSQAWSRFKSSQYLADRFLSSIGCPMLSKACSYGLRAAILLATRPDGTYQPIRELSNSLGISFHFLTKILQQLTVSGILESHKGPKGGVSLARPATKISVYDVVVAIDGTGVFEKCILGLPGCGSLDPCPLHSRWASERSRIETMMRRQSVGALASGVSQRAERLSG